MTETKTDNILRGYTSKDNAYKVENYPWGFKLRCTIFYWIESKKGHGDRFGSYTIDPRTGRANKPKYSTYSEFKYMYLNDAGHVTHADIRPYYIEKFEERFNFILKCIGLEAISEIQKENLRSSYGMQVSLNAPYQYKRYSDARKEDFKTWVNGKLAHIRSCDFKDLVSYSPRPVEDVPEI